MTKEVKRRRSNSHDSFEISGYVSGSFVSTVFHKEFFMQRNKGFTMIELMVVILIVGILAAVLVPMMRGRIDAAKWSEANAAAGQIRTAVRSFCAEKGPNFNYGSVNLTGGVANWGATIGITSDDLNGRYFLSGAYTLSGVVTTATDPNFGRCIVTVDATTAPGPGGAPTTAPTTRTLTVDGTWQ
jgi:type IV pilus assembly protein PilA